MSNEHPAPSRRSFLQTSAAATAGAVLLTAAPVHAAGSDILKVGLVGCGGRGSKAAVESLRADKNTQLTALCDVFEDRLTASLGGLKEEFGDRVDVPKERQFTGLDGYKHLIDSGVDVVLLCTTPAFRPLHVAYAVEKGKHIFMEKPHGVDATGVRSVLESVKKANEKGLCMVGGFCWRYHDPKREVVKRIHDGMIGDVQVMHSTYLTGELWYREHEDRPPVEYQLRNWYYYTWLSGDFYVEQHIHSIDKINWVMKGETPIAAHGMGGRQTRTAKKYGNVWDHFAVVFEYAGGRRVITECRQVDKVFNSVHDFVYGTKGSGELMDHTLTPYGGQTWKLTGAAAKGNDMYQREHDELYAAIRSGKPINDGEQSALSTLMGIMGREAAYSSQRITWEQMLHSKQNLMPAELAASDDKPVDPTPVPGKYKFV